MENYGIKSDSESPSVREGLQSTTALVIEQGIQVTAASVAGCSLPGFWGKKSHMDLLPSLIRTAIAR